MDSYFKAAVCDLDKLLDDFEQNPEDAEGSPATLTLPAVVFPEDSSCTSTSLAEEDFVSISANPSALPNNSSQYGSSVKYCNTPTNYNSYPKDNEARARPLIGVDLLSSVDNRAAKIRAPPCPDRALKPMCDLVSDTGSAFLQTNRHDSPNQMDMAEKQLEELLVDFDSPVDSLAGNALPADDGNTLGKQSPKKVCLHNQLFTTELPSSFCLLDITLPGISEGTSRPHDAVSTGNSDVPDPLENDTDNFCNDKNCDSSSNSMEDEDLPCTMVGDETVCPFGKSSGDNDEREQVSNSSVDSLVPQVALHRNDDKMGQESENTVLQEGLDNEMGSSPRQKSSLSCLPMAVSICGSLVASLESQENVEPLSTEEESETVFPDHHITDPVSFLKVQCTFETDNPVNHVEHLVPANVLGKEVDQSATTGVLEVTPFYHLDTNQDCVSIPEATLPLDDGLDSGTFAEEAVCPTAVESPRTSLEYSFVDSILSEIEKGDKVVTDEELDAFLKKQCTTDPSGIPGDKCINEGFCELNGDTAELIPQEGFMQLENSSREQDRLAEPDSGHTSVTDESKDSFSNSQDNDHSRTDLIKKYDSAVSQPILNNQYSHFGGARPKQIYGQSQSIVSTFETEERGKNEARELHTGSSVVNSFQHATAPSTPEEVPSQSGVNSSYCYQDGSVNGFDYDELSEPPPYQEAPGKDGDDPVTKNLVHEAEGLGLRQPPWMPDSEAPNCMKCLQKFTFTKRRHHCRACGKVYCAVCCSRKCKLKYLEKEARVCIICYEVIHRAQAFERMMSPTGAGPSPNPNVPSEYCSTIPPMQQAQAAGTINSPPPTVMVPVSVLKHPGAEGFPREQRRVWFADGILPNGEVADTSRLSAGSRRPSQESGSGSLEPTVTASTSVSPAACSPEESAELERVPEQVGGITATHAVPGEADHPPVGGPLDYSMLCCISDLVEKTPSFVPEDEEALPPLLVFTSEEPGRDMLVEERPALSQVLLLLEEGGPQPLTFVLNANLLVNVKLINYSGEKCWCFSSNGLQGVGQKELVFVIQCLPDETTIPRDMFGLYISTYQDAEKGKFVEDLGNITFTESFLGSKDHGGFLFFLPTFQPQEGLPLPHAPYLFGVLIQKLEVPWAKVFPLRLFLRLGAEYNVYPNTVVSVRYRKALFRENGHTIMNLLADLRNYQYSLPVVEGVRIHMEMGNIYIDIPKSKFNEILKVVNSSNEHVISMGANFSTEADSHLVCIQNEEGAFQTQANSMDGKTRKVTGASFVVFNGALKASSGFIAKSSIIEDGLMVQIPPETMEALRQAFRDQADFQIACGKADSEQVRENVNIRWVKWTAPNSTGMVSPVDGKSLDGALNVRLQQDTEFETDGKTIKCTEVFCQLKSPSDFLPTVLTSHSHFLAEIATASCTALCPHLSILKTSGINSLGLRISMIADTVEYQAGSGGCFLPQRYMNELDCALIPVIHGGNSSIPQQSMDLEFIFYITELLC